jgi:hypothetical protein
MTGLMAFAPRTTVRRLSVLAAAVAALIALAPAGAVPTASAVPRDTGPPSAPGSPNAPAEPRASAEPDAPHVSARPGHVVMVIRHGEKPDDENEGIDADGEPDDSSMTEVGWQRADNLVDIFAPPRRAPRAGLSRPTAIYAAGANEDGKGERMRQTVAPLARKLGVRVDTEFGKGDEQALVEAVSAEPGPTLVCWSHSGIPDIAAAFGEVTPTPPTTWPDDRFDVVWTFTATASGGWKFAQIVQRALPDDRWSAISDEPESRPAPTE